jgi:ABC-type methionine transport system ATPase subunit
MPKRWVKLTFPAKLIKKPVTFMMARRFGVVPNIRRAKVTATVGEVVLELEGSKAGLEKGVAWLSRQGVKVEPVTGDAIE